MYYEKLRDLICKEEEINTQLNWYFGKHLHESPMELRHILWYMEIKRLGTFERDIQETVWILDFSKSLYEQEEACERIYNYLITL